MNYALIFKLIGNILKVEALFLLAPLGVSLVCDAADAPAFLWTALAAATAGTLLSLLKPKDKRFWARDAFVAAALCWIVFSLIGALPFYFSGCFKSFTDCVFESVSGFTTTGATILTEVESMPRGILFWRGFSHWIGGMGVLVFMLAVMPPTNASAVHLLKAETTGPAPDKIVPKIRETARMMYLIYVVMTVLLVVCLLIAGLPLYDTLTHAFSIAGTGGFSIRNASFGAYDNVAAEIIATIFMFLFGVSFSLYFYLTRKNYKQVFKDEELLFYFFSVIAVTAMITIDISGLYGSFWEALRHSSFQVSSIMTTTGFATADFNFWPHFSQLLLLLLMITGCCAGSTGGGVKLIRILLLFKAIRVGVDKIIHPRSVKTIMINGKKTDSDTIAKVSTFFFTYFLMFFIATLLISIEGKDLVTCSTAVISTLSNSGPGLGGVGPMENYSAFTPFSKIVLTFCMLTGRLEFFPILILLKPSVWRQGSQT